MGRFLDGIGTTLSIIMLSGIGYIIYDRWSVIAEGVLLTLAFLFMVGITVLCALPIERILGVHQEG